eukprot:TRINITY_DN2365_c0_g3_i2.p1 TRINITY_DN2365_c0_g3~~TRINITY_DN2365_c0_g3_i2.p1  ORF type:complete len:178 (+),score=25.72 TRINITY_DN2365_c0_g3_i2:297-830(+)
MQSLFGKVKRVISRSIHKMQPSRPKRTPTHQAWESTRDNHDKPHGVEFTEDNLVLAFHGKFTFVPIAESCNNCWLKDETIIYQGSRITYAEYIYTRLVPPSLRRQDDCLFWIMETGPDSIQVPKEKVQLALKAHETKVLFHLFSPLSLSFFFVCDHNNPPSLRILQKLRRRRDKVCL